MTVDKPVITAAWVFDCLREQGVVIPDHWGEDTSMTEVRATAGDLTMLMMIAACEDVSGVVWPVDLIEGCDTVGMLAGFADVKSSQNRTDRATA